MGTQNNLVAKAVRYALATGMAATFVAAPAFAADEKKNDDEKIVITGSRIKRVDVEGPSPITVIDRADIDASGDNSVADVLRQSTFNSFGSFRERSGVAGGAVGNAAVSLRGLGSSRTLILIDGKRAPSSPAFGGGGAQNLNLIPIAAVERIEVLRDGASAIYGSDAVAGVINIILRKDFDGLVMSVTAERPTQEGADASAFSLSGGVTSGKGNITYVLDHFERKELLNADRSFTNQGFSSFGFPGSFWAYDHATGTYQGLFHDDRCPTNLGDSSEFPNSFINGGNGCGFNYAATSANSAALARDTLFVSSNYELSDNLTFTSRTTITRTDGQGRYAAAPAVTAQFPTMAFDNPLNPMPGSDLTIAFRNVPGGTRDTHTVDTLIDVLVGIEGANDWMGGTDWSVSVHHSRAHVTDISTGLGFTSALQAAINDESFDIFGVRGDSLETVFDVAKTFGHTGLNEGQTVTYTLDGDIAFQLFEMPSGSVPLVLGFEYEDLNFFTENDPQSNSGNVFGTAGGDNVKNGRYRKSLYAEVVVPILENLEADIAVRYDDYSDFGDTVNPKISLGYRPTDSILLRASYGTGFRAPTMTQLHGNQSQSFNSAIDHYGCSIGVSSCSSTQYQNLSGGNADLGAETSDSLTLGVVFSPLQDLTLSVDYYDIELDGSIGVPGIQSILNNDRDSHTAGGSGDPRVIRSGTGKIIVINRQNSNLDSLKTSGFDFDVEYKLDAGNVGEFNFGAVVSYVDKFDSIDEEGAQGVGVGEFFASGAAQPEYRVNFNTGWTRGDWAANMQVQYIPSTDNLNAEGETIDKLASWTTVDLQVVYNTPWNGKLSVGARNITNEDPPINTTTLDSPFYAQSLHDIFGRVPYIRYEQSF